MKHRYFAAVLPLFVLFSCSKTKQLSNTSPDVLSSETDHTWYCFNGGSIEKTTAPQDAPMQPETPWTEAVRISSASCAAGDGSTIPAAYAIVNRAGVIVFNDNKMQLYTDADLFADRSADSIVFQNDTPLFHLYKSSFFNQTVKTGTGGDKLHPFLVQFDTAAHIVYPVISCENLGLSADSEVNDYVWDGNTFICSVKTETNTKTAFRYLSVQPEIPLLSMSPVSAKKNLLISAADKESFRSQKSPKPFVSAPDRLKKMLSVLPDDTAYYITCYTAGGHSPRLYLKQKPDDNTVPLTAQALLTDTCVCAVFRDGTTYITGALFGRHILQNGNTSAFRLPKLPAGYEYSAFTISGTTMYAAWEESSFYKTGRSGFISLDLDKILYNSIRGK
ncbi:MAG: hypothetical protein M0P01_09930 [Treponema sp.]|nr:hypothetical protein [Treponema sp.]